MNVNITSFVKNIWAGRITMTMFCIARNDARRTTTFTKERQREDTALVEFCGIFHISKLHPSTNERSFSTNRRSPRATPRWPSSWDRKSCWVGKNFCTSHHHCHTPPSHLECNQTCTCTDNSLIWDFCDIALQMDMACGGIHPDLQQRYFNVSIFEAPVNNSNANNANSPES